MDQLEKKTIHTKRVFEYTYYASPAAANKANPAILWLHGFPDSAHMWHECIPHFYDTPYKLIVPDLLGYGGTSKPLDVEAYGLAGQIEDLLEILDAEGVDKCISLGHDWGAPLAQRVYNYHPERTAAVILLNVSYSRPTGEHFDLDAVNAMTEKIFGYGFLSYWNFFTDPSTPEFIEERLERFWVLMHGVGQGITAKVWGAKDGLRNFLLGTDPIPLKAYASQPKWRDACLERLKRDGLTTPLLWYTAYKNNINTPADAALPEETKDGVCRVPFFYVGCTQDEIARPDTIEQPRAEGLLPDFEQHILECNHWCAMEKPDELALCIKEWVTRRIPVA